MSRINRTNCAPAAGPFSNAVAVTCQGCVFVSNRLQSWRHKQPQCELELEACDMEGLSHVCKTPLCEMGSWSHAIRIFTAKTGNSISTTHGTFWELDAVPALLRSACLSLNRFQRSHDLLRSHLRTLRSRQASQWLHQIAAGQQSLCKGFRQRRWHQSRQISEERHHVSSQHDYFYAFARRRKRAVLGFPSS